MSTATPIVEVAAAVMLRDDGRQFLLAQRPEGKVYAGYWEFPGGKVEAGETVRDALQWALLRGSRSGRVAWQFARDYAGRFES